MATLLIVDGLSIGVTPEQLTMEFGAYGAVEWARIVVDHYGRSLAFAYVQMRTLEAADHARRALDGSRMLDRYIRVAHATVDAAAVQRFSTVPSQCTTDATD
jgi:RNA recognition motif-containing protein